MKTYLACCVLAICLTDIATAQRPHSSVVIGESLAKVKNPKPGKLVSPFGVDFDKQGNMYIVELSGGRIHKLDTTGKLTTIAGDGSKSYTGDGGPAKDATFNGMHNLAVTPDGDDFYRAKRGIAVCHLGYTFRTPPIPIDESTHVGRWENEMIGVYVRVSTTGQNIDGQKRELERWLRGNVSDGTAVRWYVDKASGTTLARPEFERLQRDIFNGELETVVCWKLDRLSRSLRDGIAVLCDWCDRGLRVVATSQMIDFNGSLGKMLAAVLLGIAEMEQEVRRERQAVGIAAEKARGVYFGRRKGATKGKPRRAQQLREKGNSVEEIANALNVSERTVFRYLR